MAGMLEEAIEDTDDWFGYVFLVCHLPRKRGGFSRQVIPAWPAACDAVRLLDFGYCVQNPRQ